MDNTFNGVQIHYVSPGETVQSKAGKNFPKKYMIIKWRTEGQFAKDVFREVEAFGDSSFLLDGYQPGEIVNVEVSLGGNLSTDRNTGLPKCWIKDNLKSITRVQAQQQAPQGYNENQVLPQGQGQPVQQQQYQQPPQGVPPAPQQGNPAANDRSGWDNSQMDEQGNIPF